MYLEHYGLAEPPFSITPDPRFVFLSERHRDALAHLLFGIGQGGGGGFVQLTGEVGTGKTTLSRLLLEQLPEDTRVALVLNPRQDPLELLQTICEELGVEVAPGSRASSKALVDALNAYLLRAHADGLRVVLIIDEAQDLSVEALEQVRLLTNLETDTRKLLQIVLLGQPELRELLARPDLRQLAQRITARFHLTPLDAPETVEYLRHRYRVAGGLRFPFDKNAVRRIHAHAGGVPRLINVVAERALLAGYAHDLATIDARTVDRAAREALPAKPRRRARPALIVAGVAVLVLAALLASPWIQRVPGPGDSVSPAIASTTDPAASAPTARTAATVDVAEPVLDTSALSASLAALPDEPSAWRAMLDAWDAPADGTVDVATGCTPIIQPGLYCTHGIARLDKLQTLARPALLELEREEATHWVLLRGADTDRVLLQLGDTRVQATRNALDAHWTGAFAAAWRGPVVLAPLVEGTATPDEAARAWITQHLGLPADTSDATLRTSLRRFQSARGLAADGIPGPETLMALAASDAGPRLARTVGTGD
ncbi:MAG TPA: AAA family ATPase [Xanthomonadaceae bacterium]|nr:AAA family ATPase [Xanthomonadaceae bacterium]